jgi:hypothetical protein
MGKVHEVLRSLESGDMDVHLFLERMNLASRQYLQGLSTTLTNDHCATNRRKECLRYSMKTANLEDHQTLLDLSDRQPEQTHGCALLGGVGPTADLIRESHATIESQLNQFTPRGLEDIREQALEGVQGGILESIAQVLDHAPSLSHASSSLSQAGEQAAGPIQDASHWARNKKIYGFTAGSTAASSIGTLVVSQE